MNAIPKVSIVIPVYNVEKYLRQCLDSAVNQTLQEIEIICVNDGSTDSSLQILQEYAQKDTRIRIIDKSNSGYGASMNRGLQMATGEYFAVLESDDFCMPDTYETLYKAAKHFDADIVRSDYFDYTTENHKIMLRQRQMTRDYSYYYRPICPNEEREVYLFVMHNWTGIYKMSFLRKNHVLYNETPGASYQDNGFFFQVFAQARRLVYIPRPFYCYRIDNVGSSIHDPGKIHAMTTEYRFIRKFLAEHPDFEQTLLPPYYARLFRAYYQTYLRIDKKQRSQYADFFRSEFVEIMKTNMLDTGMLTERHRQLLLALLHSSAEFESVVAGTNKLKRKLHTLREVYALDGIRGIKNRILEKMHRL